MFLLRGGEREGELVSAATGEGEEQRGRYARGLAGLCASINESNGAMPFEIGMNWRL